MLKGEQSAILSTFIKPPFVINIFVLSIFEWPFYTGFTALLKTLKFILELEFTDGAEKIVILKSSSKKPSKSSFRHLHY